MKLKSSNKIQVEGGMSSMTDLVFLLLIFFIIISTLVNTSHNIDLPDASGDPSLSSPIKIYIDSENKYFINNNPLAISPSDLNQELMSRIGENKTIELLADKNTHREYAFNVIKFAKQNALKIVIKTKGG